MNILFFLTPKSQVEYVLEDYSIRQTAEKLSFHHYTAIPVLSKEGKYISTVSDGDLFWYIKQNTGMNYRDAEETPIKCVPHQREVQAIRYDANMDDLLSLATQQNFVPVLDDHQVFIGIITRKAIINYFVEKYKVQINPVS